MVQEKALFGCTLVGRSLENTHETCDHQQDNYNGTKKLLDEYFSTKVNGTYEQNIFRNLIQRNIKSFETR